MVIEFSVGNFRSIRTIQTISLVASPIVSKDKEIDNNNIISYDSDTSLLKSLAIYGANGSGKSNIIRGLLAMLYFTRDSFKNDELTSILYEPFELDNQSKNKPSFFQIVFLSNKNMYRYGFELKKNEVYSEWLFGPANKNEVFYFTRSKNDIKVNKKSFPEGVGLEKGKTKNTNLFLNVTNAFNGTISKEIKNFFINKIGVSSGIGDTGFRQATLELLKSDKHKKRIIDFMRNADMGLENIQRRLVDNEEDNIEKNETSKEKAKKENHILLGIRNIRNSKGEVIGSKETLFDFFESEGTKKYFNYIGAVIEALENGMSLFIDEFDSRLHPLITKSIVKLFNSKKFNKGKAQLVIVTHDTNLLDSALMRRDQIYFTEKLKNGESKYYSLINIKGIRNDASFNKDYIKGKYGAIPFIGDFKLLF